MILGCVLGAGWALLPIPGHAGRLAAGETRGIWRTQEQDGANCLYLFLSLAGRKVDYADVTTALEATGRGKSLIGLRDAAQRLGLDVTIYHWGPGQLIHAPTPVIAHLDSYNGVGGSFVLIVQDFNTHCDTVNGANATLQELGAEDFRHLWSGYVLAPTQPEPSRTPELLSCGIGALILAGYGWFRIRRALPVAVPSARSAVT